MSERTLGRLVNPREFKVGKLPVGRAILRLSHISSDEDTNHGVREINQLLQHNGVVILDYHQSYTDTVVTAAQLLDKCPIKKVLAPVAAKHINTRVKGHLLSAMQQIPGVELATVYRREELDLSYETFKEKYGFGKNRALYENQEYVRKCEEYAKKPGHVIIIAPFGTRRKNITSENPQIRSGVYDLLSKNNIPTFCTLVHNRSLHMSPFPLEFPGYTAFLTMNQSINREFSKLKDSVENYKNGK